MEENLKQFTSTDGRDIIKIAIYGPESTGKTTLAKQLASHFDTVWIPEFARDYLQKKWDNEQKICEVGDMLPIAYGQIRLENDGLEKANTFLFADTCLLVTKVFSESYYGFCDPILDKAARKHKYDLFFLTDVDVPWEKDDLRDKPQERSETFDTFKKALIDNKKPFVTLSGDAEKRFQKAVAILEEWQKAKEIGLTAHDFVQILEYKIPLEQIKNQLQIFKSGIAKAILDRPAISGDGIVTLFKEGFEKYAAYFDERKDNLKLLKFVPASGAASRMFKFLNEFLNEFDFENETINAYINRKKSTHLNVFLAGMEKFPFFNTIDKKLKELYPDFLSWDRNRKNYNFIKLLLETEHFDYANKPKGILPFHKYKTHTATAVEEHLNETVYYSNSEANLHFTVSENHRKHFEDIINSVKRKIEKQSGVTINTTFSYQDKTTDTIAVSLDNNPFRDDNEKLTFRPGGHGTLIKNLNQLDADIIFVKNIDNVIQNHVETIALYKKALAGMLLELQDEIFSCLRKLENKVTETQIDKIADFIQSKLNVELSEDFPKYTIEHKIESLTKKLNRPIRICGMVKNEGEPGGGPFWVKDHKGNLSLQIVEASQVDISNEKQAEILGKSTHFNPVDLVCATKNYKGEKFDLENFIDQNSGFIVDKNKNGKPLKGYELPGLWNGAMAKWITVFAEVPLITFNPVKTVNDLLKSAHQPQ